MSRTLLPLVMVLAACLSLVQGRITIPRSADSGAAGPMARSRQETLEDLVEMRFGMFNHFNMGTFTGEEWAKPNQDPLKFAPKAVNCSQWAEAAVKAKMKYGVLTTKHHDGFCLWPTAYNKYNVAYSSYPHDIVEQYVTAFRAAGLKVGIYFSIWDRTHPVQAYDTRHDVPSTASIQPENIPYVLNQIRELLTNYGKIDMFVTDGYAWQMGQQAVPYQQIRELVRSLQPDIVMVDHGGLSVPYLGDAIYFEEPLKIKSPSGNKYASLQGNTITGNHWFWHSDAPTSEPMSKSSILSHLSDLETKYTSFILNCPPNPDGNLDTNIVKRLEEVGEEWKHNESRAPLPMQQLRVEHPVTPVTATATGFHTGEGPLLAIDGLSDKNFETCWSTFNLTLPQSLTVDLGSTWSDITSLEYLPKQWNRGSNANGDVTSYDIHTSIDGKTFKQVTSGKWAADNTLKLAEWASGNVRFVRIDVKGGDGDYSNICELRIGGRVTKPTLVLQLKA